MSNPVPLTVETTLAPGRRLVRFDRIEAELTETPDRLALFQDRGFRQRLFSALDARIGPDGLLSLDVFDTLLLRDGSSELRRFVEIGERMAACAKHRLAPADCFLARHLGTRASYRAGPRVDGCREGSLTEIHATAARLLGIADHVAERFVEAELEYEATRLLPNRLLLDYVRRHRALGGQVVLVSDMYMHADQITRLLSRCGVTEAAYDAIYSSADTKVSKASGGIFALVREAGKCGHVLHVGDSLRGDYQRPRDAGWEAMLLPVPRRLLQERRRDHDACLAELQSDHGLRLEGEIAA